MHGDSPETIGKRINDMNERRDKKGLPPFAIWRSVHSIIRNSEAEVKKELEPYYQCAGGKPRV